MVECPDDICVGQGYCMHETDPSDVEVLRRVQDGAEHRLRAAIEKRYGGVPADVVIDEYMAAIFQPLERANGS